MKRIWKMHKTFLLGRIDKALDEARPLRGWLAWIVWRDDELRHYYETMLEIEMELKFSDSVAPSTSQSFIAVQPPLSENTGKPSVSSRRFRLALVMSAAVVCFVGVILPLIMNGYHQRQLSPKPLAVVDVPHRVPIEFPEADDEKIDFTLLMAVVKQAGPDIHFPSNSLLKFVHPDSRFDVVTAFSEHPLESTLLILERTRIINRYKLDKHDLEAEKKESKDFT